MPAPVPAPGEWPAPVASAPTLEAALQPTPCGAVLVAPPVRSDAPPAPPAGCVPLLEALRVGEHVVFSRMFEAADVPLNATDQYTVFVPEDGKAVLPGAGSGIGGNSGITGLLSAYGVDTRTTVTIRSSPVFSRVKAFVPYYIVRGAYSMDELLQRSPSNHLRTLFDTASQTCSDPNDEASTKQSDGDIRIERVEGAVGLTDDSTNTVIQATIIKGNIVACGGTYVHLIRGVLNPCCNDRNADCTSAPLDAKQVDTSIEVSEISGTASGAAVAGAVAATAAGVAAALLLRA